ncbi:adhesion G-protein coupled receptor V1-like isoform X1 [Styela clava]
MDIENWKYIVVNVNSSKIEVFLNGELKAFRNADISLSNATEGIIYIGNNYENSHVNFIGLLQDFRIYSQPLVQEQIQQLYELPAQSDVSPISGVIEYRQDERNKNVIVDAVNDTLTEFNEEFYLVLLDSTDGAVIDSVDKKADIVVLKSDNANGLFGFYKSCQPSRIEEGGSTRCTIERTLGFEGSVTVNWVIESDTKDNENKDDFEQHSGSVIFAPEQKESSFTLNVIEDQKPEISESHHVILQSVSSHDNVISSTSYSGASINKNFKSSTVVIEKGDKAHGIFQFISGPVPQISDRDNIPVNREPLIVHVEEEQPVVSLLIVRAAGWHGEVTVEWRTRDGEAISSESPKDFVSAAGTLTFEDGEGYKFINITLLDDDTPELQKSFYVDMLTPTGGAEVNEASHAEIIISPSDNAYGVYQFNPESLSVFVEEPDSGKNATKLQVKRTGGVLGQTVLKWKVKSDPDGDLDHDSGEVNFNFGQRSTEIEISVLADDVPEFAEHFTVKLVEVSHGELSSTGSLLAILTVPANDDPHGIVIFKPGAVNVDEGGINATLAVNRLAGLNGRIRVHYKTVDSTDGNSTLQGIAIPDRDFSVQQSSFLIHENVTTETFTIPILDDDIPETDEDFYVQLTFVELVPSGVVENSPRLGSASETLARVVINENDSPHGVLELSLSSVVVNEEWSDEDKTVVEIVRKFGTFGEITVGVMAVKENAMPDEDFSLINDKVTFLEGEGRKPFPVHIINDINPELEELFTLQLQPDSVTGDATLGDDTTCRVTIEKSDYPYGYLEISVLQSVVSEPAQGEEGVPVVFTVKRKGGLLGIVAVKWTAFVDGQEQVNVDEDTGSSDYEGIESGESSGEVQSDIDISSGVLYFVSNQDEKTFKIKVMPDDIPENDEIVTVKLDRIMKRSRFNGVINPEKDRTTIKIPANDYPYGMVSLEHNNYDVEELEKGEAVLKLKVIRSAGLFGMLRVVYSTEEIDLISEIIDKKENIIAQYFEDPSSITSEVASKPKQEVDLTSQSNSLMTCAETCIRQQTCIGFLYSDITTKCAWMPSSETPTGLDLQPEGGGNGDINENENVYMAPAAKFRYYLKDIEKTDLLYDSQARSGMDFEPITGASLLLQEGQTSGNIAVKILRDDSPELDEFFKVHIINVSVIDIDSMETNRPLIVGNKESNIRIKQNDSPHGMFTIHSSVSTPEDNGMIIEAEERPQLSLEMIVERKGGSVGEVTVDWKVHGGSALRDMDFSGDDATLKFNHGEKKKVISLSVIDDNIPELNEDINVELQNPTGGAIISETEGKVHVIILANDNVGGIITFSQISRAVIGNEGDSIQLDVIRSEPAEGSCKVTWKIDNENASDGVNATEGILHFPPKVKTASFWLNLIADNTPEIKEQYTVRLVDVISIGIPQTGKAAIDVQGSVSSITIHGSDDPHGLFKFSETSQVADATEEIEELKLFVSRGFGSVGNVKVYFDVVPGSLSTLNPDIKPAEPFVDFTFLSSGIDQDGRHFILFEDGVTSVPIVFNIIDDDIPEMNEIFHVNLTEVVLLERPKDAINFIPPSIDADYSSSQVVIDANDGTKGMINFHPDFVHFEAIETEGTETNITLTIIREKGTYGKVEFFVFPQNREAIHGEDYQCEPTTITIPDSQDKVYFPITILDDDIPEGDETFEVLIGNPSIGLEIGNSTKSTIKILSNDDAHGKLSFSNEETLYLEEPNNESMTGSKADLVITRNPESGVFGDISVKYRVERNESQSTDTQSVSSDIFPVEGYIVIKDGVQNEVLEISAVTDSVAELDEHFIVTLHDPQGGATLSDKITKQIVIKANDAPYGRFKIVPKGIRSGNSFTEVEEGPGVKILELDIIREQGLLENVFVSVKTRNGTAQPLSQDHDQSPILCAIQTFDASSMSSFHSFTTGSNQFLLVLSADRSGPLSTRIGSSGTLRTLTPGVHTTLYKYNGLYTPVQTIETDGASAATSFTTGDKNYLFITNHGRYGRYETMSRLYKVSENGSLIVTDEITTKGANDVSHFKHENEDYLIVANSIDNNQISSIDSYVYRLNKLQDKLTLIQTLPTRGASGVRTFNWNNAVYLAIANRRDTEISGNSLVHSAIYKWTQNENEIYSFTNRKSIDVSHSTAVEIIETGNMVYVILSSVGFEGDETNSQEIERVDIYKVAFGGPQHSIILNKHQSLNISNVVSINAQSVDADMFDMFESVEDNLEEIHLLGIASSSESSLYWLNPVSGNFEPVSEVGPSKAILPIPVYSRHKNTSLIAIAVDFVNSEEDKARDFINTAVKSGIYYLSKSTDKISEDVDYIPIMSDLVLKFEPGKTTHSFALSVFDDDIPEKEESFFVYLDNSIDTRSEVDTEFGTMEIKILSNDDAHGVIGFAKDSLIKLVEETEDNNTFTLNLLREPAAYGDITIQWEAVGSLSDITPLEGKVTFGDGQTKAGIQMTILADDIPEVEEFVEIFLSEVTESGNERPHLGAKINSSTSTSTIRILPNDSPHGMLRWSATSLRNVIKEPETLSGATQLVTLDLLRQQGQLGDIQVFYKTKIASNLPIKSQAMPGADYIARDDSITLMENITSATIAISIVPDDIPEDIESFYVVLTDVKIIGESMFNSQPGIGPPGAETAEILIDENDHARGFIQFNVTRNSKDAVEAFEMPGTNTSFKLPLIRLFGAFRSVGVEWIAKPITASGSDFYPHHGSVHFEEGQRNAFIEIFIVDDNDVEFVETFTVQLIGKPGGAKLGGDVSATVNILPNDSPSGMFGFVQTRRSVKESRTANDLEGKVEFDVQRFQGSSEDVTVSWSLERSAFSDITPMLGKLHFSINERRKRIVLRTLPDQILEGDESYAVKLVSATGGAEISPVAGNAIVTIKADQGAAGTISISQSSTNILTAEPTNLYNGSSVVKLERGPGHFGECYVRWQITPADVSTFATTVGGVRFKNLENETQIILQTVDDNIPEISQDFTLRLTSSTGGAIIDPVSNSARITVAASDSPHGTFTFSQPVYYVKEEGGNVTPGVAPTIVTTPHMTTGTATQPHFVSAIASLTLLRNDGHLGEVSVSVSTSDGTATVNEDYYAVSKNIVFSDGEFTKTVDVELLNDLLPEGPEEFFINITDVTLHSHSNNDYIPRGTNNITLDIPPKIGGVSSAVVQITKSDGAEGIIEFPNNLKQIEVKENNGTVQIPIIRLHGHYGEVSVTVKTMDKTAKRSVDYLTPTAGINIIFKDGQKMAYAKITIVDDEEMEMTETFVVVLSGVNGGAELGNHLITEVIIAKSDYPNGRLHFLDGIDTLTVRNPPAGGEGTKRNFILERTGGNMGEINPKWKIVRTGPYYGETTSSTPISDDFASSTSGSFQFSDGEGGQKEILITILPTTESQEVEEHFAIVLEDTDPAEISETEGNITFTVSKKGNPNGILKFSGTPEDIARQKVVREPDSGSLQVVFPVVREQGTLGEVVLHWQAEPGNSEIGADPDTDLKESTGEVTFRDGQSNAEVIVYVKGDDTAELLERFSVKLTNVEGGAVLDRNVVTREFTVQPNDNPHGVFSIFSNDQNIIVLPDSSRVIQVNVTRQHGFFGRVVVSFIIEFNNPKGDSSYLDSDTGDLYIPDGSSFATTEIPIQSTAFLAVGDTFTIRLSTVEYMDNDVTIPPKLSDQVQAIVSVTVEAGNPQVGFDPIVSSVYNNTRNAARMTLKRIGLYGDVTVHWVSGYPRNRKTTDFREGQTTPSSDSVTMSDENEKMNVSLTLFPNSVDAESFSAYILRVTSLVAGGAEISKNHEVTEFEPCGVVRFSTASRNVIVTEDSAKVSLTVQRLYGSRYDIDLIYSTTPVTAIPGKDFMPVTNGRIKLKSAQQEGTINIQLIKDNIPEMRKEFIVTITEAIEDLGFYNGLSPRVLHSEAISRVTIKESDDARGILKFEQPEIIVNEKSNDGSNIVVIMVDILRTVGTFGEISVMMSTIGGGERWQDKYMRDVKGNEQADDGIREYLLSQDGRRATAGEDYEIRQINATFKINQNKIQVPIVILDDDEPEPLESFFVFLHSPTGGAKLGDFRTQNGGRIMKVDIPANDYPNGNVGFASRDGVIIYEDSSSRSLDLVVSRKSAYGNVTIKWRAITDYTYNIKEGSSNTPERIDLTDQLEKTSGEIFCPKPKLDCIITIKLKDDQIAEFENWFLVEIYQVSAEAKIDSTRRFINVTMADSDHPFGMFQFTLQSRLPVVSKGNKAVGLTIERIGGHRFKSEVHFYTKQLKSIINIARTTLYPAVADVDYVKIIGKADFNPGQEEAFINIPLHHDLSSPNPLPQIFQVKLSHVSGDGSINYEYDTANVTIVGKENTKRVWRVYEALQQNLDDGVIQSVLAQLHSLTDEPMDNEQVRIFHGVLNNIIDHAKQRKLPSQIQEAVYDLFCKLLDPNRSDAVLGFTEFGDTFEQFVFSLMTGMDCTPDDSATVAFGKCSHAVLQSARWYPEIINGHKFAGKGRSALDYFEIPTDLLNVQATGVDSPNPTCYDISFIEYSSQTWFDVIGEKGAMSNKIFSVSINEKPIANLVNPVRYRIHTKDSRISPKGAECVLWNEASKRWLSSPETCTVEYDTDTYVECACHHMSVYAARGPTDDLAGYNEATYVACFICAVAAAVTILGHHVCSRHTTFASKLMMHMLFACGLTQLFFVVSTLASETANEDGCAAIAIFLHYFWLAQFTWILVQAFNIWKVLVMSNDNTSQILTIFFIIGWGLPAVIVALHSIIMYALGFTNLPQIYGDVHSNGDMCFIMDAKAGLLAAVAPACISMMVTCTIGLQLYQRDNTWKQYDDLFRGRFNQTEIPLLFWFFFLLSFSWLWGGLHLAYGQMWMLVLFILFNMVQGTYLLIVYGILHNQIVRPIKSPYETDDTAVPVNAYATSTAGSQAPSVTGDVLNRSTQNLVAKGKDQLEWSGSDPNFSRSQVMTRGNMEDSFNQDDSADFDDLMFALKTGTVIEHSPAEHIHVSPIKHTSPLRVINDVIDDDNGSTSSPRHDPSTYPIADTHL